jgi:competence protein ComEA
VGCATDEGPRRDLSGRERQLLGLTIDVNSATPEDLACVPGLSGRLAVAVVRERERTGPFERLDDLIRVPGIGPARLARARPFLAIGP